MSVARKVRVLIVDDSAFMRSMLKRVVEKDPRFEVVDMATDGKEGVEKTKSLRPDVVTMDIEMPVMTGLDALEQIMTTCPTPVVMLSTLTEQGARVTLEALDKGAVDFLPKALKDARRNVFQASAILHEKLYAASQASVRPAAPSVVAKPVVSSINNFRKAEIAVIGSSTGGPKALQEVISQLPANLRVPVVIAQHMPAEFTGALAKRLNETSSLTVKELVKGEAIQAGCVYIAPGGLHTRVIRGGAGFCVDTAPDSGESLFKPSVEVLGQSVENIFSDKVLAVMLTGMGSDGAQSFTSLKNKGAHVIVQDEATSTVYGMPRSVVELGGATEILPLSQIAARVASLLS
ncbi:MAG: chemotaxis response regulator protein-glutamate methylesterase [Alphaproteobacteria bacterium]|nr:chemotaxis response regulator protein-glutamate methylesterase [Alphaproteobacteria bacterium]MDD9919322.1 chemotaxis response regulator protein-glutamate methylesterase [Alphaproteobacteria bacterium]